MEKFDYKFENDFGLHARPAGVLVKTAKNFESNITVVKGDGNRASAKGLFALLGLKIEGGDTVSVEAEGEEMRRKQLKALNVYLKIILKIRKMMLPKPRHERVLLDNFLKSVFLFAEKVNLKGENDLIWLF